MTPCSCMMCGMPVFSGIVIEYHRDDVKGITYTHGDECLYKTEVYLGSMGMDIDTQAPVRWDRVMRNYV